MSTLTKEWLMKTIAELEEERDAVPGVVNEDAANALTAMKLALTSLEAEKEYKHHSIIAEQLAHVLSNMDATDHQRAIISCAVDRLNHNAEILQKAQTAQEATLYEPSPTDSVNAPLKFTDVEDRAWVVGAEWMRDAFKRENPHLRIANDNDPAPVFVPDELTREEYKRRFMEDEDFDDTFRGGWKAHRAAMLQGGEQTNYRAIVERIAEIIHGKVTDIDLLTVTVKSMKDELQK